MKPKQNSAAARENRRTIEVPGGTDRFSTEASFSPPIGSQWSLQKGRRGYYIDFSSKADSPEWPPRWLLPNDRELHVATAQWGLGAWERYLGEGDEAWREAAIRAGEHLIEIQIDAGAREGALLHWVPMPHTYRIDPPWISAITQGEAASLFVRLYAETGREEFAVGAQRALGPMRTPTAAGGVLAEVDGLPFFEEYPTHPPSLVLNGAIFAVWGFYDVAEALDDKDARGWYEGAVDALATNINRYDTGFWSRYDLYPHPLANVASPAYHLLHINQLTVLARLARREEFGVVRARFEAYRSSRPDRIRAIGKKVAFRLATPRNRHLAQRLPWNNRVRRRHGDRDIVVLCYHAVSDSWNSALSVTTEQLRGHVQLMLDAGFRPTTFTEGVLSPRPHKSFAITFDDAYASVAERAKPILDELGAPGTVFVPTALADRDQPMTWPGISEWVGGPHERELCPMSWETLSMLAESGWEIGSHTASHARLPELSDSDALSELRRSRKECEQRLGRPCLSLAYPYGACDDREVMLAARAGYLSAATLPPPFLGISSLAWPRIGVYGVDSTWRFRLKVWKGMRRLRSSRIGPLVGLAARGTKHRAGVPS